MVTNVVGVILGGGEGKRLQPLTRDRSKPAVPLGGKYRLVDIPISNCINSRIRRLYLLTQFNSVSLHEHVYSTFVFDQFHQGFVRILAAQQTPRDDTWYEGTADAVRKTINFYLEEKPDYILILSGDQLYRMDFQEVLEEHIKKGADVTIATKPVARREAGALGIMHIDSNQRIVEFAEKPGDTPALDALRAPLYKDERYLASMGIYIFNRKALVELLDKDEKDFGKNIIPAAINNYKVYSHIHEGYWKDIGTVGTFWEANLALTNVVPEFTFYDARTPIYTHARNLPPSKINKCDIEQCLLTEGSILSGSRLSNSLVGVRAVVGENSLISNSYLMGADHYFEEEDHGATLAYPAIGLGRNCVVDRAIVDKNARIGDGVVISPHGKADGTVTDLFTVRDGIIVIPKNAVIPAGTQL